MIELSMLGDALGAACEFSEAQRLEEYTDPKTGLVEKMHPAYGDSAAITDDTQMALFSFEALLFWDREDTANLKLEFERAYLRWFDCQEEHYFYMRSLQGMSLGGQSYTMAEPLQPEGMDQKRGWLARYEKMYDGRAPGGTCLTALSNLSSGWGEMFRPSKGSGGVMRAHPIALIDDYETAIEAAEISAKVSHTHIDGWMPAKMQVAILHRMLHQNMPLDIAVDEVIEEFMHMSHVRSHSLLRQARILSVHRDRHEFMKRMIASIGEGWTGDETLAIAVFCALVGRDAKHSLSLSVTHDGDSDTCGAVCGALVGAAIDGAMDLPDDWKLIDEDKEIAQKLLNAWENNITPPEGEQTEPKRGGKAKPQADYDDTPLSLDMIDDLDNEAQLQAWLGYMNGN